jgi:hypothetical protein
LNIAGCHSQFPKRPAFSKRAVRKTKIRIQAFLSTLLKRRLKTLKLIPKNLENLKLQDFLGLFCCVVFYRTLENLTNKTARVKTDSRKKFVLR